MGIVKKGVGINLNSANVHYMDHLAVICVIMQIPLLITDKSVLKLIEGLYPDLQIQYEDPAEVTPDFLASHFDVFFQSDLCHREDFYAKFHPFELKYNKVIRNVHCPHGFSDKGFYLEKSAYEDIALIYGENMLDLFRSRDLIQKLHSYVITGNYRYSYYKKHQMHFDSIANEQIFSCFNKQQFTILYAPTWNDEESSSSFFEATEMLLDNAPKEYNILIKLHPHLEEDDIVGYYRIKSRYEKKGNVVFIKDFPVIYPLLERADAYIGDMSSVGYDFLVFNKPMFFLNHRNIQSFLYRCGVEVQSDEYADIYRIIDRELPKDKERFSILRKDVYKYTFGEEISFELIRNNVIKAYN